MLIIRLISILGCTITELHTKEKLGRGENKVSGKG